MFAEIKKLNKKAVARLAVISAIAIGITVGMLFITALRPKQKQFCAKCHNNTLLRISFNNACKNLLSENIACIECHTHKNKGMAVMATEIRDEHCTAEGCHTLSKLSAKEVRYKTITPFQHKTHFAINSSHQVDSQGEGGNFPKEDVITEQYGSAENLKLRCTACHANTGGDKHFDIDVNTCNTCHFIDTTKPLHTQDKKPISDCTLCHSHVEKTIDIYGKTFNHERYEDNKKASCIDCHLNTTQGNGKVEKESCYQCHQTVADNFQSAPDMHNNHIIKHKTTCTPCHTSITHSWVKRNNSGASADDQFFINVGHKVQDFVMMGMGGAGVEGQPDPMYLATLNCSACHKDKRHYANVNPEVCNNCHEKGFDRILSEQMQFVTSRMHLLKTIITKAKRLDPDNSSHTVQEAETNYNLIREDGSSGAHNMKYVKYLLEYSIANLRQSVVSSDTSSFLTQSCIDRCHVNYMSYRTLYEGEIFRHRTHSPDQGLECSQCHGDDIVSIKTHGSLIIQNKDCWGCHHKKADKTTVNPLPADKDENSVRSSVLTSSRIKWHIRRFPWKEGFRDNKDCLSCHDDVEDYRNGAVPTIIKKIPDMMSKAISCTDCHKLKSDGLSFESVRGHCIECHNNDYGLLYDAWKETLGREIKQISESKTDICATNIRNSLRLVQTHGMHNFRLSQMLLRYMYENRQ